jgi:hypothetical protein
MDTKTYKVEFTPKKFFLARTAACAMVGLLNSWKKNERENIMALLTLKTIVELFKALIL